MSKHTSGPWQARDDYTTDGFVTIIGNIDGEYVDGKPECTYDVVCVCEDEYGERLKNVAANVRLIASAPDLLEALHGLNGILGTAESNASGTPEWEHVSAKVNAARKAIAKALGEQS